MTADLVRCHRMTVRGQPDRGVPRSRPVPQGLRGITTSREATRLPAA